MTPAGTSNELDVQNDWEENTQKAHTLSIQTGDEIVGNTRKKRHPQANKQKTQKAKTNRQLLANCKRLSRRMHIEGAIERKDADSMEAKRQKRNKIKTKQKDCNARERQYNTASANENVRRIQFRASCG